MKFTLRMGIVEMCIGGAVWLTYYLVTGDKSFGGVLFSILLSLPIGYGAYYLMNWKNLIVDIDLDSDYDPFRE